jgi:hypothetical protein
MVRNYGFLIFISQWKIRWTGCTGARAHRCSPVTVEEDEPDEAVLEGCSPEHERRQRGSATEVKNGDGLSSAQVQRKVRGSSAKRGERGCEGRGCSSPFIGADGAPGRGGRVVMANVNGFKAIEGGRGEGGGFKEGKSWRARYGFDSASSRSGARRRGG